MRARRRCECGAPLVVFASARAKRASRAARAGRPVALKGHELCGRCWRALVAAAAAAW